jgi:hypothetical protein
MVGKSSQIVLRLEPELLALADEVTALVAKASGLDEAQRAMVVRTAMRRGLELMRDELKAKLAPKAKR